MKHRLQKLILPLLCLTGLALILYPQVSNLWNRHTSSRTIANYTAEVSETTDEEYVDMFTEALEYNRDLRKMGGYILSDEMLERYNTLLDVGGLGIMAFVEIPSLDVTLPIYHGTDPAVLQIAVGHVEWTSLPTGGVGNHTVVCGHRGLPSAKLFTDLPNMEVGELFFVHVLNEQLTYEVDQIVTVNPDDMSELQPEDGKDYFTLLTCTPYGINTHRLLVRGHRIENPEEVTPTYIAAEATEIDPMIVAPIIALPLLLLLLLPGTGKNRSRKGKK